MLPTPCFMSVMLTLISWSSTPKVFVPNLTQFLPGIREITRSEQDDNITAPVNAVARAPKKRTKVKCVPFVTNVPQARVELFNNNAAAKHRLLPIRQTFNSISFSSPLQCTYLRTFFLYLFICPFTRMWSKRLMKQQVLCHSCWNNYMEMLFTATVLLRNRPYSIDSGVVTGRRGNRLS